MGGRWRQAGESRSSHHVTLSLFLKITNFFRKKKEHKSPLAEFFQFYFFRLLQARTFPPGGGFIALATLKLLLISALMHAAMMMLITSSRNQRREQERDHICIYDIRSTFDVDHVSPLGRVGRRTSFHRIDASLDRRVLQGYVMY